MTFLNTALILDAVRTGFSYLQIASMYEIIQTFNQPPGSDKSYARLMCWGLFFGQTVEGEYIPSSQPPSMYLPTLMNSPFSVLFMVGFSTRHENIRLNLLRVRENYLLHLPSRMTLASIVSVWLSRAIRL